MGIEVVSSSSVTHERGFEAEAFGSDYFLPDAERLRKKQLVVVDRLKRIAPQLKFGPYTHYGLNPRDDPNARKYEDARMILADGTHLQYSGNPNYEVDDGVYLFAYYYATPSNEFGRMMLDVYQQMAEDYGAVNYIDEFSYGHVRSDVVTS